MNSTPASRRATLVVGLVDGRDQHPDDVVRQAVVFAQRLGAELVFATVDPTHYEVRKNPDGTVVASDVDPDLADEEIVERVDPDFVARVASIVEPSTVGFSFRALAGEPARGLSELASEVDADAIVVGTRKSGLRTTAHEFFSGSVAAHLAHHQHRPVIVIPLDPVAHDQPLPWEEH
jgi:nucleotide-binding universal stress UspA family protein